MSIVNEAGERVRPTPKVDRTPTDRDPTLCLRNQRWLDIKRLFGFSNRGLAEFLNQKFRTIDQAINAALADEQDALARETLGYESSPVVHAASGLTEDDVVYLLSEYDPESELGSHPMFESVLGPLADQILGPIPADVGQLATMHAA